MVTVTEFAEYNCLTGSEDNQSVDEIVHLDKSKLKDVDVSDAESDIEQSEILSRLAGTLSRLRTKKFHTAENSRARIHSLESVTENGEGSDDDAQENNKHPLKQVYTSDSFADAAEALATRYSETNFALDAVLFFFRFESQGLDETRIAVIQEIHLSDAYRPSADDILDPAEQVVRQRMEKGLVYPARALREPDDEDIEEEIYLNEDRAAVYQRSHANYWSTFAQLETELKANEILWKGDSNDESADDAGRLDEVKQARDDVSELQSVDELPDVYTDLSDLEVTVTPGGEKSVIGFTIEEITDRDGIHLVRDSGGRHHVIITKGRPKIIHVNESDALETDDEDIDLFPDLDEYDSPDDVPGLADENNQ
ncbi:hypothetical protein [Haloferax marisrubri]|uniref:hypothetical protein n=1 Tax=Haloferax marisrubri TaxID=1544719 RepID=UPI000A8881BB|nr:hypothetical protein [Haloferax marisrubri]